MSSGQENDKDKHVKNDGMSHAGSGIFYVYICVLYLKLTYV